jgi:hypothetical protein
LGAESFSNGAFYTISFHGCSAGLERNAKTEMPQIIGNPKDDALRESEGLVAAEELLELPRLREPASAAQGTGLRGQALLAGDLSNQPLTALGAAALEDNPARGRLHARAEAMPAAPLGTTGLPGSFHGAVN